MLFHRAIAFAVPLAALIGCKDPSILIPVAQQASRIDPCDSNDVDRSLVVRDQATLSAGDFSFQRTIEAIRLSSGGAPTTDAALAQTLTSGLLTNPFTQPESGLPIPASLRFNESALTGANLLTQMQPIALFNRFDLADAGGAHCGEYRIVYGRYPNTATNRYLLIFEAVLPNPAPALGIEGCRPVAEFWHGLSDTALSPAQRATALEDFFYVGLPGFSPVVTHSNYGVPLGQVRSNMFMVPSGPFEWNLREWRTLFDGAGRPVFVPDTVKDNPVAEFYNATSSNPNPALFGAEQALFQTDFMGARIPNLLDAELEALASGNPAPTGCDLVNSVGAGFPSRFDEFQGNAGPAGASDNPNVVASPAFRADIDSTVTSLGVPATITNAHVLNRAGAMTCGGCHQFTTGQAIGPGTLWPGPAAGGFVHVREQGVAPPAMTPLSSALTSCFLPARQSILETFVCQSPSPDAGVADTGTTDSGGADSGADAGVDAGPTPCDLYNPCGSGQYCEFSIYNVCGSSGPGICQPSPSGCPPTYGQEVCGCDGQTYSSACEAQHAGTDVASSGACGGGCNQRPPRGCCFEDAQCGRGEICVGEVCSTGQAGTCVGSALRDGECWEDGQCRRGERCRGAQICPCGLACLVPDSPGRCEATSSVSPVVSAEAERVAEAEGAVLSSVEDAKREFLAAPAQRELEVLDNAVRQERSRERNRPGAFIRVRRSH